MWIPLLVFHLDFLPFSYEQLLTVFRPYSSLPRNELVYILDILLTRPYVLLYPPKLHTVDACRFLGLYEKCQPTFDEATYQDFPWSCTFRRGQQILLLVNQRIVSYWFGFGFATTLPFTTTSAMSSLAEPFWIATINRFLIFLSPSFWNKVC